MAKELVDKYTLPNDCRIVYGEIEIIVWATSKIKDKRYRKSQDNELVDKVFKEADYFIKNSCCDWSKAYKLKS